MGYLRKERGAAALQIHIKKKLEHAFLWQDLPQTIENRNSGVGGIYSYSQKSSFAALFSSWRQTAAAEGTGAPFISMRSSLQTLGDGTGIAGQGMGLATA